MDRVVAANDGAVILFLLVEDMVGLVMIVYGMELICIS